MRLLWRQIGFGLLLPLFVAGHVAAASAWPEEAVPLADLLSADGKERAAAQAAYMWAHYLAQTPDDREAALVWYLRAIDTRPGDGFIQAEFLTLWPNPRQAAAVQHYLVPLARRHPEAVELNLLVARAWLESGEDRTALRRLWRLDAQTRRQAALLVHERVIIYRRRGLLRAADDLLREATAGPLADDFLTRYTAASFYDQVAYSPATRLSLRTRHEWQTLAYRHALAAAALPVGRQDADRVVALANFLLEADFLVPTSRLLERLHQTPAPLYVYGELLAQCRERRGSLAAAAEIWHALAEQMPAFADGHYHEARVRLELGDVDAAEAAARTACKRLPEPARAQALLAEILLARDNGDLAEAADLVDAARQARPDDAGFLATAAWVAYRRGDLPAAAQHMRDALAVQGDAASPRTRTRAETIFTAAANAQ